MKRNQWKQENIRLGTHGEDYGSWMSNPVFYIIGGIMEQVHRVVFPTPPFWLVRAITLQFDIDASSFHIDLATLSRWLCKQ